MEPPNLPGSELEYLFISRREKGSAALSWEPSRETHSFGIHPYVYSSICKVLGTVPGI